MSVAIETSLQPQQLLEVERRLRDLPAALRAREPLMESLATGLESQTRRRITDEKRAPDGSPWESWSKKYAKTRHGNQSLLQAEGHFLDSIVSEHSADHSLAGSNLIQAAIHQEGGTSDMPPGPAAVPARAYLGISDANEAELQAVVDDWLAQTVREALQ